ncbi:hypothetical protein A8C56_10495 [Niabella ginsenosidivorans]|uniref:DUF4876 domain-containing protein n=1 Tax=Niabella ginsenosidivorans TaxID=1176587 RepID=A0A1A9I160_9BACT|nr:DUF4876 domain-containing protein [Niabella ginsenosidivorans]ANH81356.1 hypothetical protein A8C56_10495 [Niabella ginsenosidivorans]
MKKQLLLFSILIAAVFFSCRKSDIDTVKAVSLSVQIEYTTEDSAFGLSKADIPVKITNLVNGQENTATTNADGIAIFESVSPGNYTVSASKNYTAEEFYAATSIPVASNVAYNATATQAVNENANIKLTLQSGKIGDLVFKQIYYAGSNTKTGASFRDEFVEIYNNSNQTIYLDSLYFGNTWQSNTKISAGGVPLDWSTSPGMPANIGDPNKDYIYARYLFMIPGNGKEHPLEPGKSMIIAQTAVNHTAPYAIYDTTNGVPVMQNIIDPSLSVDLSKADFEINLIKYLNDITPYKWDVDNPNVKNVDVVHVRQGNDWVMDASGREDFFMFKTKTPFPVNEWPRYSVPGSPASFCAQVKVADIIDAVEILTPLETNRVPKRFPVSLDVSGTFVTGGQYSSQSLIRKTVKIVEGRRILQDTNNSSNDFETKTKADPSKTDASFEK